MKNRKLQYLFITSFFLSILAQFLGPKVNFMRLILKAKYHNIPLTIEQLHNANKYPPNIQTTDITDLFFIDLNLGSMLNYPLFNKECINEKLLMKKGEVQFEIIKQLPLDKPFTIDRAVCHSIKFNGSIIEYLNEREKILRKKVTSLMTLANIHLDKAIINNDKKLALKLIKFQVLLLEFECRFNRGCNGENIKNIFAPSFEKFLSLKIIQKDNVAQLIKLLKQLRNSNFFSRKSMFYSNIIMFSSTLKKDLRLTKNTYMYVNYPLIFRYEGLQRVKNQELSRFIDLTLFLKEEYSSENYYKFAENTFKERNKEIINPATNVATAYSMGYNFELDSLLDNYIERLKLLK
ncbi:hypothetical protein AAEX28_05710 [Lentisphaerota bacterium WC36G]|nr:hypothetical protein LJT99_08570 [Lentisphaerae bacterium WC36]